MPQDQDHAAAEMSDFVLDVGGSRLRGHRRFVRRCCHWIAEEGPGTLDEATVKEIITRRAREEYGSVLAMILLPFLLNIISGLILEWWKRRNGAWLLRFDDAP